MQSVFQPYQLQAIRAIINMLRERTGSGVPSGLQNQREGLTASQVGSIPTLPRHNKEIANSLLKRIHPDNPLRTNRRQQTALPASERAYFLRENRYINGQNF